MYSIIDAAYRNVCIDYEVVVVIKSRTKLTRKRAIYRRFAGLQVANPHSCELLDVSESIKKK